MKDVFINGLDIGIKEGDKECENWYMFDGTRYIKVSIIDMYSIRYGREFSQEEINRCEAREKELKEQLQFFKEQGYKIVKLMEPEGHGKGYEEVIGACMYIKDLIRKKFLTLHPFASNYFEPCYDFESCGCTFFVYKPKEWF